VEDLNPYDYYITPEEIEIAAQHGISATTFYNRVRQLGWPKEKAMTTPPRKRTFHSAKWINTAEKNGICYGTYKYRVNQLGWSPERAATQPLQDRKTQAKMAYEASRKYPPEIVEKLKQNGINYNTFRTRIYRGWDMLKAATTPTMTPREIGLMTKEKRSRDFRRIFGRR
jgi:hypothetical protein